MIQTNGRQAIDYVREQTDTVILSYSTGKDSLATWLAVKPHFPNIIPVYYYLVPDLDFTNRYLAYIENKLDTRVIRLPHPYLTWTLRHAAYQHPAEALGYARARHTDYTYDDYANMLREDLDVPHAWTAVGVTQNDSLNRRFSIRKLGTARKANQSFYPIGDWTKSEIVGAVKASGIYLPADYRIWGRSFDGTDWFFLEGVRRHYPKDYERILDFYPLARLEHTRYQIRQEHPHA